MNKQHPTYSQELALFDSLNSEIDAAWDKLVSTSARVSQCRDALGRQKGYLNEHQFPTMLEAASDDMARAQELVDKQRRRRIYYASTRLAMAKGCQSLMSERDKFARTVMKVYATVPHIQNLPLQTSLYSLLHKRLVAAEAFNNKVMDTFSRDSNSDPTCGQASNSLNDFFTEWRLRYLQAKKPGGARQEQQVAHLDIEQMAYIAYMPNERHQPFFAENQQLIAAIEECIFVEQAQTDQFFAPRSLKRGSDLSTKPHVIESKLQEVWRHYKLLKCNLNEPLYAQHLERTIQLGAKAGDGIANLKLEQNIKRGALALARQAIDTHNERIKGAIEKLQALIETLIDDSTIARWMTEENSQVLVNNLLFADAVIQLGQAHIATWKEELEETATTVLATKASMAETLRAIVSQGPYRGLAWTYHGNGQYTEPL